MPTTSRPRNAPRKPRADVGAQDRPRLGSAHADRVRSAGPVGRRRVRARCGRGLGGPASRRRRERRRRRSRHGCIAQNGPDAYNARASRPPRAAHARARLHVNRLCGSGLQAIWSAAQELRWGGIDVAVAGGDESMSRTPFLEYGARGNSRLGDRTLLDGTLAILTDPFSGRHMGTTAEVVASRYSVSREEQDAFAVESQRRAATDAARAAFSERDRARDHHGRKPSRCRSTSTRGRGRLLRRWPGCDRRSRRTARSPPATPRASTTVPQRRY